MYFEDTIIDYIDLVRDSVPEAIKIFTEGNCGSFARMLNKTFPGGKILHNIDHAVYEYHGNYYDITGRIKRKTVKKNKLYQNMIPIEEYGIDEAIILLKPKYKIE